MSRQNTWLFIFNYLFTFIKEQLSCVYCYKALTPEMSSINTKQICSQKCIYLLLSDLFEVSAMQLLL